MWLNRKGAGQGHSTMHSRSRPLLALRAPEVASDPVGQVPLGASGPQDSDKLVDVRMSHVHM
eukprot:3296309-Pyramimonas_sp.AAC.1